VLALLVLLPSCSLLSGAESSNLSICPTPREYTPEMQQQFATYLTSIPSHASIWILLADYHELRQQLKECS